jgi:hypothetical protein
VNEVARQSQSKRSGGIAIDLGQQLRGLPDGTHVVIKAPDE